MVLKMTTRARMTVRAVLSVVALAVGTGYAVPASQPAGPFDLVFAGGRVMDPASGLNAVRHVGIRGGTIAAVSAAPLTGATNLDVTGLIVAPGFIDPHAHWQTMEGNRYQARDGVTTALELESGAMPIDDWYASREGRALRSRSWSCRLHRTFRWPVSHLRARNGLPRRPSTRRSRRRVPADSRSSKHGARRSHGRDGAPSAGTSARALGRR